MDGEAAAHEARRAGTEASLDADRSALIQCLFTTPTIFKKVSLNNQETPPDSHQI